MKISWLRSLVKQARLILVLILSCIHKRRSGSATIDFPKWRTSRRPCKAYNNGENSIHFLMPKNPVPQIWQADFLDRSPMMAPLLGVPGWWADNQDASFYDNSAYFRAKRAVP
jgi:hypothetical protein